MVWWMVNLKGKDFISIADFTREELEYLIDLGIHLKMRLNIGLLSETLKGKTIALLFKKHSTRTRFSFSAAAAQLGAQTFYTRVDELQLSRGETVADTARVLDRYVNTLVIRTYEQEEVLEYARFMKAPVVNALTNQEHPTQILADLMTIKEKIGDLTGLKMVYTGVFPWNIPNSLILACSKFGINLTLAAPKGHEPNEKIWKLGELEAGKNRTQLEVVHNLAEAVKGADAIYADSWYAMGQEAIIEQLKKKYSTGGFTVTQKIMRSAKPNALFMHCLPAHRGEEAVNEVIDGPQSVVWDQAENKMHIAKAILSSVI